MKVKGRKKAIENIDLNKLRERIERTGKSYSEVSREMGYNATYMNHVFRGETPVTATLKILLKTLYGIDVSDCVKEEHEEPKEKHEEPKTGFSEEEKKELYKIIYTAVYEAVRKAWSE